MSYQSQNGSDFLTDPNPSNTEVSCNISANHTNRYQAEILLNAILRSPTHVKQVGLLSRSSGIFNNKVVSSINHAIDILFSKSEKGFETYFALAEYKTPSSRSTSNAAGAYAFWIDIDCSEAKAKSGTGYLTEAEAEFALQKFCKETGINPPTHIIHSGGGIHVYWVMGSFLERDTWLIYAKKFKQLTKQLNFLADDSRTSDLASVLRVPGTFNYKYSPPKLVTLNYASYNFIETAVLLDGIDRAYEKFCSVAITSSSNNIIHVDFSGTRFEKFGHPNLATLASALALLDPDCDERTWKLYRIAPMARAARDYADSSVALYELAKSWSSGELQGKQSMAWFSCLGNGKCGKDVFNTVWNRFLNERPSDLMLTTLGSIYRDAKEAGWFEESFQVVVNEGGQ